MTLRVRSVTSRGCGGLQSGRMRAFASFALALSAVLRTAACSSETSETGSPLARGSIGVELADMLLETWPDLDATDCGSACFSLDYAKVPAAPNPKFWEYTNGVPLHALWLLYEKTGDSRYRDYVKRFVDRWIDADGKIDYARPYPDGAMPNDPRVQDTVQPASLLFALYAEHQDARYLKAMSNVRQVLSTLSVLHEDGAPRYAPGAFWHKPNYQNQQWLDGVYMSEPFLARYGATLADRVSAGDASRCFETATAQIKYLAENTHDPVTGLYFHGWISDGGSEDWFITGGGLNPALGKVPPVTGTRVSPVLWSRSIAWLFVGTIDTLAYLPETHPDRAALLEVVRNIARGLERFQDPETGLWYQVIDVRNDALPAEGGYPDEGVPAQPNWPETSASALFSYGLAKAARLDLIEDAYRGVALAGWKGVLSKIDKTPDGRLIVHGTVVGMSLGGTYNAYVNADFRSDLEGGDPPARPECADQLSKQSPFHSPPLDCKYTYVRDNVPQGLAAVMLAASELERPGR